MLKTTPNLKELYTEAQMTLEEILETFKNYTIYGFLENTAIIVVDNDSIVIEFDSIGYDDEDCMPIIYEAYFEWVGYPFDRIVNSYLEDSYSRPTKLN